MTDRPRTPRRNRDDRGGPRHGHGIRPNFYMKRDSLGPRGILQDRCSARVPHDLCSCARSARPVLLDDLPCPARFRHAWGEPATGAGPCAPHHGAGAPAPESRTLAGSCARHRTRGRESMGPGEPLLPVGRRRRAHRAPGAPTRGHMRTTPAIAAQSTRLRNRAIGGLSASAAGLASTMSARR